MYGAVCRHSVVSGTGRTCPEGGNVGLVLGAGCRVLPPKALRLWHTWHHAWVRLRSCDPMETIHACTDFESMNNISRATLHYSYLCDC